MKKDVAAAAGSPSRKAIPRRHKDKPTSFQKKFAEELKEKGKNNKKQKRKQKMFKAKEECSDIRFSPNGLWLAAASRDNNIYIFDVMRNYKKVGCCKGHSSYITHIDFSADSNFIQSNDGAYEILYWEVGVDDAGESIGARQFTSTMAMCDTKWDSWSCVMGWPVMGIWSDYSDGTDINALARSNSEEFAVAGDIISRQPLHLARSKRLVEDGGSSIRAIAATSLALNFPVRIPIYSVGGNDCSIFQWRHIAEDG